MKWFKKDSKPSEVVMSNDKCDVSSGVARDRFEKTSAPSWIALYGLGQPSVSMEALASVVLSLGFERDAKGHFTCRKGDAVIHMLNMVNPGTFPEAMSGACLGFVLLLTTDAPAADVGQAFSMMMACVDAMAAAKMSMAWGAQPDRCFEDVEAWDRWTALQRQAIATLELV